MLVPCYELIICSKVIRSANIHETYGNVLYSFNISHAKTTAALIA